MASIATNETVDRAGMEAFVAQRHRGVLLTQRRDGRPQMSPITMGLHQGTVLIATYPDRAKAVNAKRNAAVSVMVIDDNFGPQWIQLDGTAEVIELPEAVEPLVDYFRCISGEHSDWTEYRQAMVAQGKCAIRLTIDAWGPISQGGFPAKLVEDGVVG